MLKLVLFAPLLLLFGSASQQQGTVTPPPAVPATAPKITPEALTHAKKMYTMDCAMCHGATGDGKGELVADMNLTLKDYSDSATLKDLSDPAIFAIIRDGKGKMPGEGPRLKPEDTWAMVALVHSFARK